MLDEDLQGFPGAATEIGKRLPVIQKATAEDFWDTEDEMSLRNLLEGIHAEPFLGHSLDPVPVT